MSISTAEQGRVSSKLPNTLGCKIPNEPKTISLPLVIGADAGAEDSEALEAETPGRAAFRF